MVVGVRFPGGELVVGMRAEAVLHEKRLFVAEVLLQAMEHGFQRRRRSLRGQTPKSRGALLVLRIHGRHLHRLDGQLALDNVNVHTAPTTIATAGTVATALRARQAALAVHASCSHSALAVAARAGRAFAGPATPIATLAGPTSSKAALPIRASAADAAIPIAAIAGTAAADGRVLGQWAHGRRGHHHGPALQWTGHEAEVDGGAVKFDADAPRPLEFRALLGCLVQGHEFARANLR
mmetsp:Transcript_106583/g.208986  ORF Transcript_106583/g.208986 Transcript_106583/m.208986 type:complete len:237 (+) Transcript_106583:620-1330(+)